MKRGKFLATLCSNAYEKFLLIARNPLEASRPQRKDETGLNVTAGKLGCIGQLAAKPRTGERPTTMAEASRAASVWQSEIEKCLCLTEWCQRDIISIEWWNGFSVVSPSLLVTKAKLNKDSQK